MLPVPFLTASIPASAYELGVDSLSFVSRLPATCSSSTGLRPIRSRQAGGRAAQCALLAAALSLPVVTAAAQEAGEAPAPTPAALPSEDEATTEEDRIARLEARLSMLEAELAARRAAEEEERAAEAEVTRVEAS